jgi:hypothetical protein
MGGGELLKAAQENSLASPSGHRLPTTLTAVKLHEEVDPGAQGVFIRGYI